MPKRFVLLNQRPIERVEQMIRRRQTGCLKVNSPSAQYSLEFANGRLISAVSSLHRVRRWKRAIARNIQPASQLTLIDSPNWERASLENALINAQIVRSQARGVLRDLCREVFFSLSGLSVQPVTWQSVENLDMVSLTYGLSAREVARLCRDSQDLAQHWKQLQLGWETVACAPVLDRGLDLSQSVFGDLIAAFDGNHSFWDLVNKHHSSPFAIARILHHFREQGIIQLQMLPDLPPLSLQRRSSLPTSARIKKSHRLILKACQTPF